MDDSDRKALSDIKTYGCHVINVMEGEGLPAFTYSIGINKQQNQADVVIIGLESPLAHAMVNDYKNRLLSGEVFESGKFYADFIDNFDVCFLPVAKQHYQEYFAWGLWLHDGDDFEVMQMIWPTSKGLWPWDNNNSEYYQWVQPLLNEGGLLGKFK